MSGVLQTRVVNSVTVPPVPISQNIILPIMDDSHPPGIISFSGGGAIVTTSNFVGDAPPETMSIDSQNENGIAFQNVGTNGKLKSTSVDDYSGLYDKHTKFNGSAKSGGAAEGEWLDHSTDLYINFANKHDFRYFNAGVPDGSIYELPVNTCFFVSSESDYNLFKNDARFEEYKGTSTQDNKGACNKGIYLNYDNGAFAASDYQVGVSKWFSGVRSGINHVHYENFDEDRWYVTSNSTLTNPEEVTHFLEKYGFSCCGYYLYDHNSSYHYKNLSLNYNTSTVTVKKLDLIMFIVKTPTKPLSGMSFFITNMVTPAGATFKSLEYGCQVNLITDSSSSNLGSSSGSNYISFDGGYTLKSDSEQIATNEDHSNHKDNIWTTTHFYVEDIHTTTQNTSFHSGGGDSEHSHYTTSTNPATFSGSSAAVPWGKLRRLIRID